MKQKAGAVNIRLIFIIIQIVLYISFLAIDITGGSISLSSKIKYGIIILCFCYALFSKGADKGILFCLKTALLFTAISDLFLLILDYYLYGVLSFIVVQQLYAVRLSMAKYHYGESKKTGGSKFGVLVRDYLIRLGLQTAAVFVICLVLDLQGIQIEALLIASAFYFICILTNAVRGVKAAIDNPRERGLVLFAFGISLFLLCDINVGFFNLSSFITLPKAVYNVLYPLSTILMWTFYAPSQVLIALSVRES